jgi:hypothetical protein
MLLDGHGVVIGVEKASSESREDRSVMLRRHGDGGVMPLKPTTVAVANSMRCGGRRHEAKVVGGVMPLAAGCGATPRGEDGEMLWQDGMVTGATMASSTISSRCVRQDVVKFSAAMTPFR